MKAQLFLDTYYPKKERKDIALLYLNEENGDGDVDLTDFTNLQFLDLKKNELSSIDLSKCKELNHLIISGSSLSTLDLSNNLKLKYIEIKENSNEIDLSLFSHLTELERLDLRNSNFGGSFKSLENCNKLQYLYIENNKRITKGLEYVPTSQLLIFDYEGTVFMEQLEPFNYDVNIWKTNYYHTKK